MYEVPSRDMARVSFRILFVLRETGSNTLATTLSQQRGCDELPK